MSPVSPDLRMLATVVIFVATYAGVALGRVPGLRIDRAGIALVGASLMIAFGTLSLEERFGRKGRRPAQGARGLVGVAARRA
jgi:hypothetical protein